jgi:predicted transcriptional regulator
VKSEKNVLDILFPKVRAELLRVLFGTPRMQRYVRELTRMTELALCTVQNELRKLESVGLVVSWSDGYRRFYRANSDHPLFSEVTHIVDQSARRLPKSSSSPPQRKRWSRGRRKPPPRKLRSSMYPPMHWNLFSHPGKT